jgi:hypothetical protein
MSELEVAVEGEALGTRSFRRTVLLAARRFKSTWFELGKLLVRVRDEAKYEEWGFETFESYCAKELHIRRQTALKLTRSFSFLAKHEPTPVLSEVGTQRAPAYEVVRVLAEAEDRGQLTNAEYRAIRDSIWDPDRSPLELKRELSQRFPRPPGEGRSDLGRLAHAARRLAEDLRGNSRIPRSVSQLAAALAQELEKLASENERD